MENNTNIVTLVADEGKVYTNTAHDIVGKTVYVMESVVDDFVQVSEEEGETIQEALNQKFEEKRKQMKSFIDK